MGSEQFLDHSVDALVSVPVRVLERVYRGVIALPYPLPVELREAVEEFYHAIGTAREDA